MTSAYLCAPKHTRKLCCRGHQFSLKRDCPKRSLSVSSKDILVLGSCTM